MTEVPIEQFGQDWHTWRMAGLGGSDIISLLGNSPFPDATPATLWREKTDPRYVRAGSYPMRMGKAWEPIVRKWYESYTGIECRPMCVEHDVESWVHASLDGWDWREQLLAEIKCPNAKVHNKALRGVVVEYYLAQVYWQLLTTGAKEARFVSYYGYGDKFAEPLKFVVVPVKANWPIQNRIYRIAREFWRAVLGHWERQRMPLRVA